MKTTSKRTRARSRSRIGTGAAPLEFEALTRRLRRAFAPNWVLGPDEVQKLIRAVARRGRRASTIVGEELLALIAEVPEDGRLAVYDPDDRKVTRRR